MKVVAIKGATHLALKQYCARHGLYMQNWVDSVLKEAIKKPPVKQGKQLAHVES